MRRTTLVSLLAAVAGCDPGWNATGHLIDALGAPVGGATLTIVYPSGRTEREVADPAGGIHLGGVGSAFEVPRASVKIEKPGFKPRTIRTLDLCFRSTEEKNLAVACGSGEGTIILARDPAYAAPDGGATVGDY